MVSGRFAVLVLLGGAVVAGAGASCGFHTAGLGASTSAAGGAGGGGTGGGTAGACGALDCGNPACLGVGCAPTPQGWTAVAFAPDPSFACPAGYVSPTTLMEANAPPGDTCACACGTPNANSCEQGQISWSLGVFCLQGWTATSDGGCDAIPGGTIGTNGADFGNSYGKGQMKPLPPSQVTCSATTTLPSLGVTGVACSPSRTGTGCGAGESCVPPVPVASTACVMKAGAGGSCPAPFTTPYTLYAPGDVTDGRSCGPCACTSQANSCSSPTLTTYDDLSCTVNPVSLVADDGCDTLSAEAGKDDSTNAYFTYTATPDTTACVAGAAVPVMGMVTASDPVMVCCP